MWQRQDRTSLRVSNGLRRPEAGPTAERERERVAACQRRAVDVTRRAPEIQCLQRGKEGQRFCDDWGAVLVDSIGAERMGEVFSRTLLAYEPGEVCGGGGY